jgi:hypothetical protein
MIIQRWLPPQMRLENLTITEYYFYMGEALRDLEKGKKAGR